MWFSTLNVPIETPVWRGMKVHLRKVLSLERHAIVGTL